MTTKGNKKKDLVESLPEYCFWVFNGPILSDLLELKEALKHEITDEQFMHHVTGDHNDFSKWVEEALKDSNCAKALRVVKKKKTMVSVIEKCLKGYKTN